MFWVGLGLAFYRTDGSQTTKIKLCNVLIVSAVAFSWRNCEWVNGSLILMVGSCSHMYHYVPFFYKPTFYFVGAQRDRQYPTVSYRKCRGKLCDHRWIPTGTSTRVTCSWKGTWTRLWAIKFYEPWTGASQPEVFGKLVSSWKTCLIALRGGVAASRTIQQPLVLSAKEERWRTTLQVTKVSCIGIMSLINAVDGRHVAWHISFMLNGSAALAHKLFIRVEGLPAYAKRFHAETDLATFIENTFYANPSPHDPELHPSNVGKNDLPQALSQSTQKKSKHSARCQIVDPEALTGIQASEKKNLLASARWGTDITGIWRVLWKYSGYPLVN